MYAEAEKRVTVSENYLRRLQSRSQPDSTGPGQQQSQAGSSRDEPARSLPSSTPDILPDQEHEQGHERDDWWYEGTNNLILDDRRSGEHRSSMCIIQEGIKLTSRLRRRIIRHTPRQTAKPNIHQLRLGRTPTLRRPIVSTTTRQPSLTTSATVRLRQTALLGAVRLHRDDILPDPTGRLHPTSGHGLHGRPNGGSRPGGMSNLQTSTTGDLVWTDVQRQPVERRRGTAGV